MNIVIDAFGGDNAPLEVIKGSIDAQKDFGVDVTLVGDEEKIKKCAQENGLDITALHIKHADTVIEICEEPTEVIKGKKDCSMAVGMKMLADGEGDAFVSAGSTGALVVGATFIVKRINTEHRHINVWILHPRILPVNQSNFFFSIFLHKQEIIRHCINMCQNLFRHMCFNIGSQ